MIQKRIFGREVFVGVLGLESNAFSARAHRGEVALAFGLSKPAHQNEYGEIDLLAAVLTWCIIACVKIDMATAAKLVRIGWQEWLYAIAKQERLPPGAYSKGYCFVVSMNMDRTSIEDVAVGPCQEIIDEIAARNSDLVPIPVPLDLVIRQLRKRARTNKVDLPRLLTPDPDTAAYEVWIREIEDYRKFALLRSGGAARGKAKKKKQDA